MYTHTLTNVVQQGPALEKSKKALVLLHGRGASARDILSLQQLLNVQAYTLFAPEASRNSWYPFSFMAPVAQNQPALDSALAMIDGVVEAIEAEGVESHSIYFLGFSQGACLALEYATRHARRWGGLAAFTGGLIGETLDRDNYGGDFAQTPVLLTTGDPDPHVPLQRVEASKEILETLGAQVRLEVYKGRPHTILQQEVALANELLFSA